MKFSKHQKEIITKIAEGIVFDIVSYLKEFNLTTYKKLDKNAVEEIVKTKEAGKTYKKLKDGVNTISMRNSFDNFQIHNSIDYIPPREEDYEQVEAVVDFSKAKISTETSYGTYEFHYLDGINVTNSFSDIKEFLTIWQECDNSTDKQFEQIQKQLSQIEQAIENSAFDNTTLDDIEKQLEEISIELNSLSGKEYDDSKIIKKLEELLEELKTENNE